MPISYLIDRERNLVRTKAWGTLSDDDILNHKRELMADPLFRPGMRQLSDVRSVTSLEVTPSGIRLMVAADVDDAPKLGDYKLAVVASEDVVFGMARMYQTLTDADHQHVGVFRSIEEAEAWLGVASPIEPRTM